MLTALKDVEDALVRYRADGERIHDQRAALASAQAAEALGADRYRAGLAAFTPALAAQQAVVQAQDELAQAQDAQAQDLVALYRALGGGWDEEAQA